MKGERKHWKVVLAVSLATLSACGGGMSDEELAEAKRNGDMCVVGGFNDAFVKAVKARLRDPNSFELAETRIDPVGPDGNHRIAMHFRSRNGFGGMNDMYAVGTVDNATCLHSTVTMLG